jgi:hypothetical protein
MCSPPGSPKVWRALPGSRTSAATASPRASSPRTISLPTRPVAPITAEVIVSPFGKARSAPPPAKPAPGEPRSRSCGGGFDLDPRVSACGGRPANPGRTHASRAIGGHPIGAGPGPSESRRSECPKQGRSDGHQMRVPTQCGGELCALARVNMSGTREPGRLSDDGFPVPWSPAHSPGAQGSCKRPAEGRLR